MIKVDKPLKIYLVITAVFLLVLGLAVYASVDFQNRKMAKLSFLDSADPLLPKAKARATETLDTLRVLFPQYPEKCYVKFPVMINELEEHRWGMLTELASDHVSLIPGEPGSEKAEGREIQIPIEQVEDWLVELPEEKVRGGFTTQLILQRQAEKGNADAAKQLQLFTDRLLQ
jgi:uncharacterized protein YegJ (DUF2314 family)